MCVPIGCLTLFFFFFCSHSHQTLGLLSTAIRLQAAALDRTLATVKVSRKDNKSFTFDLVFNIITQLSLLFYL